MATGTITVPGNGQVSTFLDTIPGFQRLPVPFQGTLRVSSNPTQSISIVGLRGRTNERGDFLITTTPPVSEQTSASTGDAYFPHFADAGGYTTQFILFSSGPGASASGSIRFMKQDGQPLDLKLR